MFIGIWHVLCFYLWHLKSYMWQAYLANDDVIVDKVCLHACFSAKKRSRNTDSATLSGSVESDAGLYVVFMTIDESNTAKESSRIVTIIKNVHRVLVSARFIDASMYRDTCHAIRITIQFARIAIPAILQRSCVFYLNVTQTFNCLLIQSASVS